MGFFDSFKRHAPAVTVSTSAELSHTEYTDEQMNLLRHGYKLDYDKRIYEPDVVWYFSGSEVYHAGVTCPGRNFVGGTPVHESEALALGLRRCRLCDFGGRPVPKKGRRPKSPAKPVSSGKTV